MYYSILFNTELEYIIDTSFKCCTNTVLLGLYIISTALDLVFIDNTELV